MLKGQLGDWFVGAGAKRLSAVDAEPNTSNQHEVGISRKMQAQVLGTEGKTKFDTKYIWIGEDQAGISESGHATYYDTRSNNPSRAAEWRLYYYPNSITGLMREGDTLFLAKTRENHLLFIVTSPNSAAESQLCWLFGIESIGDKFVARSFGDDAPKIDFAARFILDEIGFEFEDPDADNLDEIIDRFGTVFPRTVTFSDLARQTLPGIDAKDDPDGALVAWLDQEEALFRRLERRVVTERLEAGFSDADGIDVDGFISFSLSVQNRRKSRMGHSLENHLEAIFRAFDIRYVRGAETENRHKPDFLFPGSDAYHAAPEAGHPHLRMLAAKSSCKDRWRQVLTEAAKISEKHLLTLEPSISENQTEQMQETHLQLVVPRSIHHSYTLQQAAWLWSVSDFIKTVKDNQALGNI